MDHQNRITVILGAGTMMEVTTLSCSSITRSVIDKHQEQFGANGWEEVPFLQYVYDKLKAYYRGNESVNFEDIFHALEMWSSLKVTENEQAVKSFRSVFGMLSDLKEDFAQVSQTLIYKGTYDLIDTVIQNVAKFENDVYKDDWFLNFFHALQEQTPLDIFTLNYDTWLEQIMGDYNDGFSPICETHQEFSANQLFSVSDCRSTINHLHGQICFTGHLPTGSIRSLTDGWYKANSYDIIENLRIYPKHLGYMAKTQAAEHVFQYPIITGLRKNDKIMLPPFDAYYMHLYQRLRENKNLLIIGYGFGDLYINALLNQFHSFHGDARKVICVGYLSPDAWSYCMNDMPFSKTMKQTVCTLFRDSELSYRFLGEEFCDCIDSSDMKSKLYLSGFKSVATSHIKDILCFYKC